MSHLDNCHTFNSKNGFLLDVCDFDFEFLKFVFLFHVCFSLRVHFISVDDLVQFVIIPFA